MLLLHLMSFLCPEKVRAIYIDHQLQEQSAKWGDFVLAQCQQLNIPCIVQAVNVADGNLENQARSARYQAYEQHIQSNEILLLAHHQQDQAETLLLRLLSGAGIHGLSAMREIDYRENLTIWRPLLNVSHEQICQWVSQLNVQNIQDPTNSDTHYDRAWCREELWSILQSRFPQMQKALSRTSYLMQDAEEILHEVLLQDLAHCGDETKLNLKQFNELPQARKRQLLSYWMKGQDQYRPSFDMVERIQSEVIDSKSDAQAAVHWSGFYYVRYQQVLYRIAKELFLAEKSNDVAPKIQQFKLNEYIDLPSGQFQISTQDIGLSFELLEKPLCLTIRQGGEKIHLYGRIGSWPLKKAIQEAQIFPWQRHTIQILSIDNVMLGAFTPKGFWLAQSVYCETGGWQPKLMNKDQTHR